MEIFRSIMTKDRRGDPGLGLFVPSLSWFYKVWVRLVPAVGNWERSTLSAVKDVLCPRMGKGGPCLEILLKILEEIFFLLKLSVIRAPIQYQKDMGGGINKFWAWGWTKEPCWWNRKQVVPDTSSIQPYCSRFSHDQAKVRLMIKPADLKAENETGRQL